MSVLIRGYRLVRANSLSYVILILFNCKVTLILSLEHARCSGLLNYLLKSAVISSAVKDLLKQPKISINFPKNINDTLLVKLCNRHYIKLKLNRSL